MNGQSVKYISLSEAAKLTNYSQEYIGLLCRQKKMKGTKIGRNWVTTKEWVEGYINKTKGKGQNIVSIKIERETAAEKETHSAFSSQPLRREAAAERKDNKSNNLLPRHNESEDFQLTESSLAKPDFGAAIDIPPIIGKLILTTIICSLFVSGFIFLQLGFQKRAIKTNLSQTVREASASIAEGINFLDSWFHSFESQPVRQIWPWNPVAEISNKIITLSDSLNTIKNETVKFASYKIAVVDNSLGVIKNELSKFSEERVASASRGLDDIKLSFVNSAEDKFSETTLVLSEEIISLDNSLVAIKNESAKFASDEIVTLISSLNTIKNETAEFAASRIIAFSWRLESISNDSKELLAEAKNNLGESSGEHSERIKNNLENFAKPLQTKLAKLSRSKDIIFAAVSDGTNINKSKQGRVAGISDEKIVDSSSQENEIRKKSDVSSPGIFQKIISLSDSLDIIKNKPAKFAADKVISFSNSLSAVRNTSIKFTANKIISLNNSLDAIKNESAKFAINEINKLYYSCELIKNKSEEKVMIALNKFGIEEKSPLVAKNLEEAKSKESIDKLEQEIIGDIQKRFDEFNGDQEFLSPAANQNFGAAIVPYSDLEDKKKKIENLKESFSDEVRIEEDESNETGTIVPSISGEDQRYLYLMVPMEKQY